MTIADLAAQLRQSLGILHKQDIQVAARLFGASRRQKAEGRLRRERSAERRQKAEVGETGQYENAALPLLTTNNQQLTTCLTQNSLAKRRKALLITHNSSPPLLGDDCAAIPDGSGYLLLAAEGMLPSLVETEPWFAGWCAVMVNVSDIYAMGGRPIAVVDTIWSDSTAISKPLLDGMKAAAETYNVPIVGGHTNGHSPYNALSVAILGRANRLLTSFDAQPGDRLLLATDFRGKPHPKHPFWNAATTADPVQLRGDLAILPELAELGLCHAGKDISMGGIVGTLLMLLETSNCGAVLNLDAVPCPAALLLERWLLCFPSYGFLLSVPPENVTKVQSYFHGRELVCEAIGDMQANHQLVLRSQGESVLFWDLAQDALTGFAPR